MSEEQDSMWMGVLERMYEKLGDNRTPEQRKADVEEHSYYTEAEADKRIRAIQEGRYLFIAGPEDGIRVREEYTKEEMIADIRRRIRK